MIVSCNGIADFRTAITEEPPRTHRAWDALIQPIYELSEALRAEDYQASIKTTSLTPDLDKIALRLGPKYRPAHQETFLTFILNTLTGEVTMVPLLGAPIKKPEGLRDHLTELMRRSETRHYLAHLRELETKPVEAVVIHKAGELKIIVSPVKQKELAELRVGGTMQLTTDFAKRPCGVDIATKDFLVVNSAGLYFKIVGAPHVLGYDVCLLVALPETKTVF